MKLERVQPEVHVIRSSAGSKSRHRSHSPGSHPLSSFSFPTRSSTLLAPLLRRFYLSAPRLPNLSTLCLVFSPSSMLSSDDFHHGSIQFYGTPFFHLHSIYLSILIRCFSLSTNSTYAILSILSKDSIWKNFRLYFDYFFLLSFRTRIDVTKERREKVVKKSSFQIQDFIT